MEILKISRILCLILVIILPNIDCVSFEEDVTLNKQQLEALQRLKARVLPKLEHDYQKTDIFILRFLRAKNFDINKAEDYLLKEMKWRRDWNYDGIHDEDWSDMERDYHIKVEGVDREGRPLVVIDLGDFDIRKAALAGKTERLARWTLKNFAMGVKKTEEFAAEGKNVTRWTMVVDLKNINAVTNVNPASFPYFIAVPLGYETHFPKTLAKVYLINTPGLFELALTVMRPVLGEETKNSIVTLGRNEAAWKPILDKAIDPSQLPKRYGGYLED